jgi:hypothetical protein
MMSGQVRLRAIINSGHCRMESPSLVVSSVRTGIFRRAHARSHNAERLLSWGSLSQAKPEFLQMVLGALRAPEPTPLSVRRAL